jgi:hypothetical protein
MKVRFPWGSGLKTNLKPPSVRKLLHIPAEIVHENDWMTRGQGILPGPQASTGRSLRKLLG